MGFLQKLFGNYSEKEIKRIMPLQQAVLALEEKYSKMSDSELRGMTDKLKAQLKTGRTLDDILPDAFAVCREASWRVLSMKHFPVQILGGIILHQGRISEMRTGEGKTLVATLPAYLNALTEKGVHIVTVNDYLARRDSEWMGKVYSFLGLTVGLVVPGMNGVDKQAAYNADITYCTNNELGFDYLRDNMAVYKHHRLQRGHNYATVDEVDSILIDEARTPLIISGQGDKSSDLYIEANKLARSLKCVRIRETDDKKTDEQMKIDGDYVVDEKAKTCTLTPSGVEKTEKFFHIDNLNDADNIAISHHVQQAIRAHGVMRRDVEYVVKDGEVLIVDEFTGRIMYGRRYNDGLHQAIEAKEGVNIAEETRTLATITFQNFFRLYDKLAGMTGTAMTEAQEFSQIYRLDVVEIPTNKPVIREDMVDSVYKTEKAKFNAVIENIVSCHEKGQPVLVGTVSIEKSELLSSLLKKKNIKHNILNAKHHEKEAEIIAQAGKFGAVTIATNMAGLGTDIVLGGNAEYLAKNELRKLDYSEELISAATGFAETDDAEILKAREIYGQYYSRYKAEIEPEAEKVREAGGLFIIGTERHESRRIDNQLRGRAGRQGDPGASKFYISTEDDLMRLFAGNRMYNVLEAVKVDENQALEFSLFAKAIENAQQAIEGRNFSARKNILEYDDVMNKQRELIYAQRNRVLDGENIKETVRKMMAETVESGVETYLVGDLAEEWNLQGLKDYFRGWLTEDRDLTFTNEELNRIEKEDIVKKLVDKAFDICDKMEAHAGSESMREFEHKVLLRSVDELWMEHIDAMDDLRQGINLRAYGQHNPVVEYRNEGYDMFNAMTEAIRERTTKSILLARFKPIDEHSERQKVAKETSTGKPTTVRGKGAVAKNALCPCGSGKKFKRCCGKGID